VGSHNGTYVNGTRVSQQELKEGDIIAIGHATFRLAGGELIEYLAALIHHRHLGTLAVHVYSGVEASRPVAWLERGRSAEDRPIFVGGTRRHRGPGVELGVGLGTGGPDEALGVLAEEEMSRRVRGLEDLQKREAGLWQGRRSGYR
jgi:hypothetical protein